MSSATETIYIAGPMRGYEYYNFHKFFEAESWLTGQGHTVFNPARMDIEETGRDARSFDAGFDWNSLPPGFCLNETCRRDIDAVSRSTGIYMLPRWELSRGAVAELHVAKWLGLKEYYEPRSDVVANSSMPQEALKQESRTRDAEEGVLEEAIRITGGDRQASYGPPDQDFRRTAEMITALFRHKFKDDEQLETYDVAQFMILLKLSRLQHSKKRDNVVDIGGYARCMDTCYTNGEGYDS